MLNIVCLLFSTIATVFKFDYGGDLMYEMSRRKPEPTLLPKQRIFNPPPTHHIGMVWEELALDDAVSYTQWVKGLQYS